MSQANQRLSHSGQRAGRVPGACSRTRRAPNTSGAGVPTSDEAEAAALAAAGGGTILKTRATAWEMLGTNDHRSQTSGQCARAGASHGNALHRSKFTRQTVGLGSSQISPASGGAGGHQSGLIHFCCAPTLSEIFPKVAELRMRAIRRQVVSFQRVECTRIQASGSACPCWNPNAWSHQRASPLNLRVDRQQSRLAN